MGDFDENYDYDQSFVGLKWSIGLVDDELIFK